MKSGKQTLLLVDDVPENIDVLREILAEDYDLKIALDGKTALEVVRSDPMPDLILLDIMMPDMNGYEVCRQLKEYPETSSIPVIFISAKNEVEDERQGLIIGAVDYIRKPFSPSIVAARVRVHLELYMMREHLESLVDERTLRLQRNLEQTISAMARTVEKKDPYTAGHQERVSELAVEIAREMDLDEEKVQALRLAGTVHDLGKIYVPSEILNRPGKLADYEFNVIKTHPVVGYEIIKDIDFPWPIAQMVRQHHERMDGSGYPDGLSNDEILLEARIMAVADVVEAMFSHRP
ncbi:MAG: HD domain-containing phosphohydrolase, partial [Candidatus Sedimenticola sp. 6PFRAG1]